jgi:Tol biopolymer transport system component
MRLPIIPLVVAIILLSTLVYVFHASRSDQNILDVPALSQLADIEGTETEVAIAPDGQRYAVIVSGDLWLLDITSGAKQQITQTAEAESSPAWSPDGKRVTFTRGTDTFHFEPTNPNQPPSLFKMDATSLSFSATSRTIFVRNRGLWIADPLGHNEREILAADPSPDVSVRSPRFSPDSVQVAFIKSMLNLRGEIWSIDVLSGMVRPLVVDRAVENPMDVAWIQEGKHLVYFTNRAGAYSLWQVDFEKSAILPLTLPLVELPLQRIGIGVWKDRVVVPRHIIDSNIVLSDGTPVVATDAIEFEPAISPNGRLTAFTVLKENKFEIWTAGIDGSNPMFRTLGREPRFFPNGYQLAYTHTDLEGNEDIWKIDTRNGDAERLTDADEIDIAADPSPDGRSLAFSSARGGSIAVWIISSFLGKRLRINDAGYAPRYSPDEKTIAFWKNDAIWTMAAEDGSNAQQVIADVPGPAYPAWTKTGPAVAVGGQIRNGKTLFTFPEPIWPRFDVLGDGRFLLSPITIQKTSLWAVDMTYRRAN